MKKLILSLILSTSILPAISQSRSGAAMIKAATLWKAASASSSGSWVNIGMGDNDRVGRVNCIAFHPNNYNIIYAGTPAGGLWKTEDHGITWRCLTDDLPTLGVSAIVVIPGTILDTIYIGTGDRDGLNVLGGETYSVGVLKSMDGGATWNATGLSFDLNDHEQVTGLIKHPYNNKIIYAATSDGFYLTTDGGATWPWIFSPDLNKNFIDIEIDPDNPDHIYLSTRANSDDSTYIFSSLNMGLVWDTIFRRKGCRTEMTVSTDPNKPKWLYAVTAKKDNSLEGVYKFLNEGSSYLQILAGKYLNLLGDKIDGKGIGGQGMYDLAIAADPTNGNRLFVGGINTWVAEDGYKWEWDNFQYFDVFELLFKKDNSHVDKHQLIFRPGTSDLYECNDGGIFHRNGKRNWEGLSKGMIISQIWRLGLNATEKDKLLAGLQDNGTHEFKGSHWNRIFHNDGFECIIDYDHPSTQYACDQYGCIVRTKRAWWGADPINITRRSYGEKKPINGLNETGDGITPYVMDPVDHKTLYIGLNNVWASTNQGGHWDKISTFGVDSPKIGAIAVAKLSETTRFIYASAGNRFWWTSDYESGDTWKKVTWDEVPGFPSTITYITIKNSPSPTAWVTMDGGYNTGGVYVFDIAKGILPIDISEGLPPVPVYCIVQNKNNLIDDELYAGTQSGVYRKVGPLEWEPYFSGLPNVRVQELEIFYSSIASATLYAATFGRGMWRTELDKPDYRLWTGKISFDWYDAKNWYPEIVPASSTSVYIPAGCPNWPLKEYLTLGIDCKNVRMYDSAELHINTNLEIGAYCKLTCDQYSKLYVGGAWKNNNDAVMVKNGYGFIPEKESEVIFNFQYDAPLYAEARSEIFRKLTIDKVVPGTGHFRPLCNIVVNDSCNIRSGYWDDASALVHSFYGNFLIAASGVFHMHMGGILEFLGTESQSITTLSSDSYNSFRTLRVNCLELRQESNLSAYNKINENLFIVKGKYSVGKLVTETVGLVTIADKSTLHLNKTTFLINYLRVDHGGLFFSEGTIGDSASIGRVGTTSFNFDVDGTIGSSFTRFDGMNESGINITTQGDVILGFNNCTFSTSQANAAMLTINNDKYTDVYDVNFNFNTSLSQKSVSKTVDTGNVRIQRYKPLNSPDFEEDRYNRIEWE